MGDFIDTHAEAMCQQMEEQGVEPIKTAAESAIPSSCAAVPSLPADECANCASNGLQEAQETQSKDFIEACAAATKNMINDTDAASNFYNHSIPAFIANLNVSFTQVLTNPAASCAGVGTGATRLFEVLPQVRSGNGNSMV